MPLTGYLKLPDIAGESRRADHEDEIDIHAIRWNVSQGTSSSVGSGRRRARSIAGPVTLGKFYDASSPYLALAALQGKSFDEAVISFRKDSGDAHLDYLKITLTNVVISSYEMSGERDDDQIGDTLQLSFESIRILYVVQADDHSSGAEHEIEYDVAAGV